MRTNKEYFDLYILRIKHTLDLCQIYHIENECGIKENTSK